MKLYLFEGYHEILVKDEETIQNDNNVLIVKDFYIVKKIPIDSNQYAQLKQHAPAILEKFFIEKQQDDAIIVTVIEKITEMKSLNGPFTFNKNKLVMTTEISDDFKKFVMAQESNIIIPNNPNVALKKVESIQDYQNKLKK